MNGARLTVTGEGANACWQQTGRKLTAWEQRMRLKRCDLWVPIDGTVYRLALGQRYSSELERLIGGGIGKLRPRTPEATGPAGGIHASASEAAHALRLALIGGGIGVCSGKRLAVSPQTACQVAGTVASGPLDRLWRLVGALVATCIHGRDATLEEIASFSIPDGPPLIPAWALEYRA